MGLAMKMCLHQTQALKNAYAGQALSTGDKHIFLFFVMNGRAGSRFCTPRHASTSFRASFRKN